ncbi:hypothetical protein [Rhodococcus koreensis]
MALAIDASSPAMVAATSGTSLASNSFTPPAGSLVAVVGTWSWAGNNAGSPALSTAGVTWTKTVEVSGGTGGWGAVTIWEAYFPTSPGSIVANMTWTGTSSQRIGLDVIVITGADPDQSTAASASIHVSSGTTHTRSVTTTRANSMIIGGLGAYGSGTPTVVSGWNDLHNVDNGSNRDRTGQRSCTTATAYTVGWTLASSNGGANAHVEILELAAVTKNATGETVTVTDGTATKSAIISKPATGDTVAVSDGTATASKIQTIPATGDTVAVADGTATKSGIFDTPVTGETVTVTDDPASATKIKLPPQPFKDDLPIPAEVLGIGRAGGDYRIQLHDVHGTTVADLDTQDTTDVKWSRALSNVSSCQLDGNTSGAEDIIKRVRPWVHWATVYRGDDYVWTGQVTQVSVRPRAWTIVVKDLATLMWRTRVPITQIWRDTDPCEIATELWDAMIRFHELSVPDARRLSSTVAYTFSVDRDRRMLHQAMDDVVKLGVEWTVIGGMALFQPALRTPGLDLAHVELSDRDFEEELEVLHDGTRFFNDTRFQGKNYGATAVKEVAGLHMQNLVSMDNLQGEDNITRAAQQSVAKTGKPRSAIIVPPGATLTPGAPVQMAELVPGVVIPVWTEVSGGVRDLLRLESVEVTISAGLEKVAVTLGEVPDVQDVAGVEVIQ